MNRFFPVALAVLLGLLGCAPGTTPHLTPTPSPTTPPLTQSAATPTPSAQAAAMQKLVDTAKKEGSVTVYSFNFLGDVGSALQAGFKNRYGINADIITGRGAEFTERLKTEARMGTRTGDFIEGSSLHVMNANNLGLTVPLKDLPVLGEKGVWKMDPLAFDAEGKVLVARPFFQQPFANTKLVKAGDEPKSWADLLQPKWKGKILFTDLLVTGNAYIVFQPLIRMGSLSEDYLRKLGAQDLLFVTGPPEGIQALARGEAPIFVATNASIASDAVRQGAPVKTLDFAEGIVGDVNLQAVIKDAPHPNAARLFADWCLTQEGQELYAKYKGATTIRKDAPAGLPAGLDVYPAKPVFPTADDTAIQGKMFLDKAWVPLLKGTK